jgi:histidinol-phosphatase
MKDKSPYLQAGLTAVNAAQTVILRYLDQDMRTELKDDMTPVTIADKEAEAIIRSTIASQFPEHTFYGEEGEKVSLENHRGFTWIIDPIDGTKSYVRKNPLFATQLALMHDGELIIGISNAPLLHELMYAEKGRGCFLNDEPVHVSGVDSIGEAYLSHGSLKYFTKLNKMDQLLKLANASRQTRGIGDFWAYHLVAQGKIEAVSLLVNEAGGRLTQLDGKPIGPQTTTALATNGLLHDTIVTAFK